MRLFPKLAGKIVNEVQKVIKEEIIVVDIDGFIIASTEQKRIGSPHEGAQIVLRTKKKLYIDETMTARLKGVKMGINMPITFEGRVAGVIGLTGDPKEVEPYAELIRRMTELIISEASFAEQLEWRTRGLESYFYEWVNLTKVDQDFIDRGLMLGIPLYQKHLCGLIQLHSENHEPLKFIHREMFEWFQRYFTSENDYLVHWGQGLFFILKNMEGSFSEDFFRTQLEKLKRFGEQKYGIHLAVGVGKTVGTSHIHQSYREAKKALRVAEKSRAIIFYRELSIEIILEEVPMETRNEFLNRTIEKLGIYPELIKTLQTYFSNNQSAKSTADEMHIHINTLHYRLKQIKELTGIDPKESEGGVIFYLALHFLPGNNLI
ncbi:CdaR family transcriptional regulator [Scopulibacillus darangshiensis]|uniref:CdaR family transcriptional regulator n=1 Tax=Scopulibacillus darangshiensis TaxID=442528 RepID=A0A4R2P7R3_9BACL|nr:sugar diacid recognition domain-containing protein [Scopulibacillus darangshiensis]TCP30980.1 CdaR family transcriptional regulator [Scopulibacillus darangshiensis]